MTPTGKALYVRDGESFIGTDISTGAWSRSAQSGGAVLALLGHVLDDVETLVPMSVTRFTADLVRPAPVGEPLTVESAVIREGKKIQVVDFTVTCRGVEHVRARALRVRNADLRETEGVPRSTTTRDPAAELPPPDEVKGLENFAGGPPFLTVAMDFRRAVLPLNGMRGIWTRLKVPVVAGEPIRATSRVTVPMDLVNLIGADFDGVRVSAINPDVSAHVVRPPVGEWVALVGETRFAPEVGHGVSVATMSDELGVLGITSTSQLLDVRPPSSG